MQRNRFTWVCSYLLEFTVCAFVGWLYEVVLEWIVYRDYIDRGLLPLPVCPIYGFGAMALLLLFRRDHRWWVVLLGSTVLTTVLELGASYLLERMGLRLWDYSAWPMQFEGRISVLSSLVFGVLALALVGGVHPLLRRFYEKAPVWLPCTLGIACGLLLAGGRVYVFFLK